MFHQLFRKYLSGGSFGQSGSSFAGGRQFAAGSPGPPFLITSADNGLSVDPITFKIVLGQSIGAIGNPAQFLDDREIPMNGFLFQMLNSVAPVLILDEANGVSQINSVTIPAIASLQLNSFPGSEGASITATNGVNDEAIGLDPINNAIQASLNGNGYLRLDLGNQIYQIGDINGVGNQSKLLINDTGSTASLTATQGGAGHAAHLLLIGAAGSELVSMFTTVAGQTTISSVDGVNKIWRAFEDTNGLFRRMQGFNQEISDGIDDGAGNVFRFLLLDILNQTYSIGDIDGNALGTQMQIFDSSSFISFLSSNSTYTELASMDFFNGIVLLGDLTNIANGTQLKVDDPGKLVDINNQTNDVAIHINGFTGFTGTLAAAIAGSKNVVSGIIVN